MIGGQSKLEFTSFKSKWKNDTGSGDNGKTRNLAFTPQIGRFVANNLAVGLEIPYSFNKEIEGENSYATSSISIVPFVRYYFGTAKIKPYLHGAIGPGWGRSKVELNENLDPNFSFEDKRNTNLFATEIGGGIAVFVNQYISIDLGLGYNSVSASDKSSNNDRKDIISGFGSNIGVVVYL